MLQWRHSFGVNLLHQVNYQAQVIAKAPGLVVCLFVLVAPGTESEINEILHQIAKRRIASKAP